MVVVKAFVHVFQGNHGAVPLVAFRSLRREFIWQDEDGSYEMAGVILRRIPP
jgi:hypothetical protein